MAPQPGADGLGGDEGDDDRGVAGRAHRPHEVQEQGVEVALGIVAEQVGDVHAAAAHDAVNHIPY